VRKDEGAFAEYCVANADLCIRIPDGMSDEDAASPPAGVATAGMGLFQKLDMKLPGEGDGGKGEQVLVSIS
jgi:NADPH:quinone reductase-like Zn-dependent oxidoreductase